MKKYQAKIKFKTEASPRQVEEVFSAMVVQLETLQDDYGKDYQVLETSIRTDLKKRKKKNGKKSKSR